MIGLVVSFLLDFLHQETVIFFWPKGLRVSYIFFHFDFGSQV